MISKIIKYTGILLIVSFSAVSIFFALTEREIVDPEFRKLISYTSFFEDRFYDKRMLATIKKDAHDKRLVLAAIDDRTLKEIGKWPLPRITWVQLIDKLQHFGAKVIAFDVFFSEMSNSCAGETPPETLIAESIQRFQSVPGNKVILPYALIAEEDARYMDKSDYFDAMPEDLYNFVVDTKQGQNLNLSVNYVGRSVYPIAQLIASEPGLSHIEAKSDSDGIFRHYQVVGNVETLYLPAFSLQSYQYYTGDSPVLEILNIGDATLKVKSGDIKLNHRGEAKVRWLGGASAFPEVSIVDIIRASDNDPKMMEVFKGNMVFVGSTAFGAHDLRHTPVDSMLPGIFFHMNMVHMLLEGKFFAPYNESTRYSWIILIAGTLMILIVQLFGHAIWDLITLIILTGGLYALDTYYLLPKGYEIKLFFCLFSIIACYSWITFLNFYLASKDKQFLKQAFGNYISPELIDDMYKSGEPPKLGGDSGIRTAYFTDIQGFSTFSEKLSATQLVELLNEYLTHMTDILLEEKGTLDKYEGDAIIAFFGAPMPLEDHAARACMVAHRMQERLGELRVKWASEGDKWPKIVHDMRMRIGINSGEIVTGNMGSASRMNYTMMGDSVNLAARLEESAKQYGIFTQVTKETMEMSGDQFLWRELDTIKVVGKSIPVTTFDLLGTKQGAAAYLQQLSTLFKQGIDLYKAQAWDQAIAIFQQTLEMEFQRFPELKGKKTNPSEIYITRCEEYKQTPPPPNWDGVYILTSK